MKEMQKEVQSKDKPRVIKRYQNRKLYDTNQSCYVTLDEIAQMIKAGEDLHVLDNKTKSDITVMTLTQLMFEAERKAKNGVPVEMLKEIIRSGDGSFSSYLRSSMPQALKRYDSGQQIMDSAPVAKPAVPAAEAS